MKYLLLVCILVSIAGCRFELGPLNIAAFGTDYEHIERNEDSEPERVTWHTKAFRGWGTSRMNTLVNQSSEQIGIEGEGISDNMTGVVKLLGDKALCAAPSIAPSCVAGAFSESRSNMTRDEAEEITAEWMAENARGLE